MEQPTLYATTHRWWVRPVRWLWRILCFFWATVFVGLVLGFIPAVLFLTRGTDPHTLIVGVILDWVGQHLVLSLVVSLLFVVLTALTWLVVRRFNSVSVQQGSISVALLQRNRAALVHTLRQEYSKRLTHSLQGARMMTLGLHERTDVTLSSAQLVFRRTHAAEERELPFGTSIVQAYDEAGPGLLLLGEPGAGKTTLLLDLAGELLIRAEGDSTQPIPVILNLSSWASKKLPLINWLVDQLQLVYGVPSHFGQAWMEQNQWLLLLDGIDEVEESARTACIEAINTYRGEHFVPLVVCSRSREYLEQEARLVLPGAVVVQPLQEKQVTDYLANAGEALATVQTVVNTNPVLQELLTTPLMLSVVVLAYRDKAVNDLPQLGTAKQQRQQVFADYVERVLDQRVTRREFTPHQTRQWLTWLVQRMQQFSLTEFYLEWLQPTWLATEQAQTLYTRFTSLLSGLTGGLLRRQGGQKIRPEETWSLLFGLLFGLALGLALGLARGLVLGLGLGLLFGLGLGLSITPLGRVSDMQITEFLRRSRRPNQGVHRLGWPELRIWLSLWLLNGPVFWLSLWLLFGGIFYLAHYFLRFLLWLSGAMPWHYVRFLEEVTERILLQRVGGGYRFVHPLFLEYFASGAALSPPSIQSLPSQQR